MQDKYQLTNILCLLKEIADLYLHGAFRATTPNMRAVFHQALLDTLAMQDDLYQKMAAKGWYPAQTVEPEKIAELKKKFSMPS